MGSMNNQGIVYDANAMLTLQAIDGGRYVCGVCVAVRNTGQKGEQGAIYGYAPAIGVCPKDGPNVRNRYAAKAVTIDGAYLILHDKNGNLVIEKSRDKSRATAHKLLQEMGNHKLATFTPAQLASLKAIAGVRTELAKLKATVRLMEETQVNDMGSLPDMIETREREIKTLQALLK